MDFLGQNIQNSAHNFRCIYLLNENVYPWGHLATGHKNAAFEKDTEVVADGYFHESEFRSAPYFDVQIDGIELVNTAF